MDSRGVLRSKPLHRSRAIRGDVDIVAHRVHVIGVADRPSRAERLRLEDCVRPRTFGKVAEWGKLLPGKISDNPGSDYRGHGHRQSLAWALLHALYSQEVTEEFVHLIDELQEAHDELCDKLDAQSGNLSDTDFTDEIGMQVLNPDKKMPSRSRASFKSWLISSLSSYGMTNDYVNSIVSCQLAINNMLMALDSGSISMPNKVNVLDPKAKL
jgi:hypothetical protein